MSLSVKALTVEFADAGYKVRLLNGFSFDCDDGQLVVLLGPSGCGKTCHGRDIPYGASGTQLSPAGSYRTSWAAACSQAERIGCSSPLWLLPT